jgi:hypothetical protein
MKTKILSPLRRDGYKAGMIMMLIALSTMLLTTACSNDDDVVNNTENIANKGYELPVTVNVTRQGDDGATRASLNETTHKLEFSTGDQLFVSGEDVSDGGAGKFAGRLTWQSGGTFSGTITTENTYSGTADALFTAGGPSTTATLLPYRYGTYDYLSIKLNNGYDAVLKQTAAKSIVTSKKLAVEQLSLESGSYTSGTGFTLRPLNAILNFTIGTSRASYPVEVKLKDNVSLTISRNVNTSSSGLATFAVGVSGTTDLNGLSLTVDGKDITLANSSKVLEAGKIYNITRIPWSINGLFSVSATKKVVFSKGNLRYMKSGESWVWSSFSNQYDYYNAYNENNWDKFCWVGASGTLNSEPDKWGISTSTANSDFGTNADDKLKSDWGYRIGTGWRTLTNDEWTYLLKTRDGATSKYGFATVNGVHGIIILPDVFVDPGRNENGETDDFVGKATSNYGYDRNVYDSNGWALMEAAGAVFLPAAGNRVEASVVTAWVGNEGYYWSSSVLDNEYAHYVNFGSSNLYPGSYNYRNNGQSVRLVRQVQ